jgi:uncharacterized protein (TIGR03790 family)
LKKRLLIVLTVIPWCPFADAQVTYADPTTVLVIVQDNLGPEPGTGNKNAGQFVADYYMQRRGIPAGNIVHIRTYIETGQGSSCIPGGPPPHDPTTIMKCDPAHSSSTNINYALFQTQIATPVLAKLKALGNKIKYIVPVYGVPITTWTVAGSVYAGVDSLLAGILIPNPLGQTGTQNPYWGSSDHIDVSTTGILLVTRLDGRSAVLAKGLVDKAIAGETVGVKGTGYFDYGPTAPLGSSTLAAYKLCKAIVPPQTCQLNDQSISGHFISSAPGTAWAWGGYDVTAANARGYTFVPGAVGAQMNSLSGDCIRCPNPTNYVNVWLAAGITATWGAVWEPFTTGYALGDTLLGRLWAGYTFGEAAYIAAPTLNWMMEFVGDPLYRPSYAKSATAYYVAPDGDDSNPGTQSAPFRHVSKAALTATQAGDTVIVMDGTYDNEGVVAPDSVVILLYSGQAASPITFKAQNRGKAILDSMNSSTTASCDGASAYFNLKNASFIVIQGFVLQNSCDSGFQSNDAAHDIVIQWNEIRNIANHAVIDPMGRNGIYLNSAQYNFTFDGNSFHDIGIGGQTVRRYDHGIYARAQSVTITNNVFYEIHGGWPIQLADGANDWLIANNTFAFRNQTNRGGQIMMWDTQSNIVIRNNIFFTPVVTPVGYAIARYRSSVSNCAIDHNLIFGAFAMLADSSGCTLDTTNQISVDPLLVNAWIPPYDFHLKAASPAIGAGAFEPSVMVDFDGTPRVSAPDIGAYAFVPNAP